MTFHHIRKAVFPVAGLGTRFLPVTKDIPKEMMPLIDRPLIHHGVDEAVASGCNDIIFVTGTGKETIFQYFQHSPELEAHLTETGKEELAEQGISMVLYPLSPTRAMQKAALEVMHAIRNDGTQVNVLDKMQQRKELYEFLDYHTFENTLDKLFKQEN